MKNSKRVIAGAMALLSAVSVASCGSSSGGDSSSSYVDKVKVASTDDIATIPDGSEKELEWLSYFDINPEPTLLFLRKRAVRSSILRHHQ